mgnify:FL=1
MNATAIVYKLLEDEAKDALFALLPSPKKVHVVGRRWYRRSYGGVYHVVDVYVDDEKVARVGPAYGYDDGYEQTAMDWLIANNYLPPRPEGDPPWYWFGKLGIEYTRRVYDVKRERVQLVI